MVLALVFGLMAEDAASQPVHYRTELPQVQDRQLQTALAASSNLSALEETTEPPAVAGLIRRARQDRERMLTALRSFGYYAGDVHIAISGLPLETEDLIARVERMVGDEPLAVVIVAEPGPLFTIGSFEVLDVTPERTKPRVEIDRSALGIDIGDPARAATVIGAEGQIVDQMRQHGHPFAAVPYRQIVVDHATGKMDVALMPEPGPYALFGEIAIEGLEEMDEDFVHSRLGDTPGRPYSPEAIHVMRDDLADLEVFNRIRVDTADALDGDNRLPVTVTVTERPRRVVGFGADYNTSEGFGGRVYWGHRNLFGQAESLRLQAEVGRVGENAPEDIDYGLAVRYRIPDFPARKQTFSAELSAGREASDAFRREAIEVLVGIDRQVTETLQVSAGVKTEISEVDDLFTSEPLYFASLPLGLRLDTTDDLLDPARGYRVALKIKPYFVDRTFLRTSLAVSTYYDVHDNGDLVLAMRTRLGSVVGEELLNIPSDKRFFSGGGGSVRGYAFQAIGPRTNEDDPLGGRSLLEFGLEARVRIADKIGLVPFIEAGQVFEDEYPSFGNSLQFGAGLGLRYFTGLGPLRFDLAFPIDKREGDDDFQLYISIGQAF